MSEDQANDTGALAGGQVRAARWWAPVVVYAGIIGLSSLPASTFDPIDPPWFLSYVAHLVVYAALGATLRWALDGSRRPWMVSLGIGWVAGTLDELYQGLIPGREPSAIDVAVDVLGVAIAAWLVGRRLMAMRSAQSTSPGPPDSGRT